MSHFLAACENGNFDEVKTFLQTHTMHRRMLLRETDANGWSCLHWAVWHNDITWTKYLLAMRELDIWAKNWEGKTAFHVALKPRGLEFYEILKLLLEFNYDFVNCYALYGRLYLHPLEYAIMDLHIDVVKLLIRFAGVNKKINGFSVLHIAVVNRRMSCIRYLVYEMDCDLSTRCDNGRLACCLYFQELLNSWLGASREEIEFAMELLSLTHKSPAEAVDVCFLLFECYRKRHSYPNAILARCLFMEVVRVLLLHHRRKCLIEKILQILPDDYCLTTLTLFEKFIFKGDQFNVLRSTRKEYLEYLDEMKYDFVRQLFVLFLADPSFFHEYIAEIIKTEWKFDISSLMDMLGTELYRTRGMTSPDVFNFVKSLLQHEFKFESFAKHLLLKDDHLLKVMMPLSNFVHVPSQLIWIFRGEKTECHYNFNESEDCVADYKLLVDRKGNQFDVVSLKNLSRMSVRKYVFGTFSHYEALSTIYSLHIPIELRRFLCYNYSNFKF